MTETVSPVDLNGKRRKAYKTVMKITSREPKGLYTVCEELDDIYETGEARRKCLKVFNESDEIPIKVGDQKVVNLA